MKTRICPYCDQPMTKAHYCDCCKSFVRHPWFMELNSGSSVEENDGLLRDEYREDYHYEPVDYSEEKESADSQQSYDYGENQNMYHAQQHEYSENISDKRQKASYYDESINGRKPKKKVKVSKVIKIVILVIVLVEFLPMLLFGIVDVIDNISDQGSAFIDDEDYDENELELTDEEAIARGEECNGKTHFDLTFDEFIALAQPALSACGVDVDDYSDSSYNNIVDTGGEDIYTYFEHDRLYFMDENLGSYLSVSWDTVSGRIHEVAFSVYGRDAAKNIYQIVEGTVAQDQTAWDTAFEEGMNEAEDEGSGFVEVEGYEIYIGASGDEENDYYISIDKSL